MGREHMEQEKLAAAPRISRATVKVKEWFLAAPVLHILLVFSSLGLLVFRFLRSDSHAMGLIVRYIARPYHEAVGAFFSALPFSVAELCYAAVILAALLYIVRAVYIIIRSSTKILHIYKLALTLLSTGLTLCLTLNLLWNSLYYSPSFQTVSGIEGSAITAEKLRTVAHWFAMLSNSYAENVERDSNGLYIMDRNSILEQSKLLYSETEKEYVTLKGPALSPKPMIFSDLMSRMGFTGFFFAPTGEANINVSSPQCMQPATIAHELAHQRGISREQEANFIAVMVCLESDSDDFKYSAALMAYQYLANALYKADYHSWQGLTQSLGSKAGMDLDFNREYWRQYESPLSTITEAAYSKFLTNQNQSLGIKSYGACVNLLGNFYYEDALAGNIP